MISDYMYSARMPFLTALKLRPQLLILVAATIAPVLLFSIGGAWLLVQHERATMQRDGLGRARSAMTAVDAELGGSIAALRGLAASPNLEAGNIPAFYQEARRALNAHPNWLNVRLVSAGGTQIFDAALPLGVEMQELVDRESFDEVLRTGRLLIGSLMPGPTTDELAVRIRFPVASGGKVRYVLSIPLKLEHLEQVLKAQRIPPDWVIALVDRNKRFIVRIPWARPGSGVSDSLRAAIERAPEGWFPGRTIEGVDTYTPYVTSELSGWVLSIAIPASTVEAGQRRMISITIAGIIATTVLALLLAWLISKRIGV